MAFIHSLSDRFAAFFVIVRAKLVHRKAELAYVNEGADFMFLLYLVYHLSEKVKSLSVLITDAKVKYCPYARYDMA